MFLPVFLSGWLGGFEWEKAAIRFVFQGWLEGT